MVAPVIEAADITTTVDDTGASPVTIDYSGYSIGDLITFVLGTDQGTTTHTIPTTGPNGDETIITLFANNTVAGAGGPVVSAFGYIATSAESAGSLSVTVSASEQYTAHSINTPAGEFDAASPYQTLVGDDGANTQDTTVSTPAWTSDATVGGRIVGFIAVDSDAMTGTATGWTIRVNTGGTRVQAMITTRDAENTSSESIAAADYTITADTWASIGFVINPPTGGGGLPGFHGANRGIARGVARGVG